MNDVVTATEAPSVGAVIEAMFGSDHQFRGWFPHHVYVLFGSADEVLYVGCSCDVRRRVREHSSRQPWWGEVARWRSLRVPDREAGLTLERLLISLLAPRYNIAGNPEGAV